MFSSRASATKLPEPLRCFDCGERTLVYVTGDVRLLDGFEARSLRHLACSSCGHRFFDTVAMDEIQAQRQGIEPRADATSEPEVRDCFDCGAPALRYEVEDVPLSDGFLVRGLRHMVCNSCGHRFYDMAAMREIRIQRDAVRPSGPPSQKSRRPSSAKAPRPGGPATTGRRAKAARSPKAAASTAKPR